MSYQWDFSGILRYGDMLLIGLFGTVKIAVISIERGQWEGAKALGMNYQMMMRRIIVPQALRRMVAPFVERSFELTKTTALASTLAYAELLYQAMQVNSITFRPMEVYTSVAVLF